ITRVSCPTDRRGQIAQLTEDGFAALAAAAPGHVEQVRRSMIDLLSPAQIGQLRQISAALIAGGDPARVTDACDGGPCPDQPAAAAQSAADVYGR
ncbi:MAG TPA: hypothetical protein VMK13_16050, partial [Streptosporangiaceae bacterium]|nr:hypothetical protein [Streptosporangiaceae bacterium]